MAIRLVGGSEHVVVRITADHPTDPPHHVAHPFSIVLCAVRPRDLEIDHGTLHGGLLLSEANMEPLSDLVEIEWVDPNRRDEKTPLFGFDEFLGQLIGLSACTYLLNELAACFDSRTQLDVYADLMLGVTSDEGSQPIPPLGLFFCCQSFSNALIQFLETLPAFVVT